VHVKAKSWQSLTDKNNNKEFILSIYWIQASPRFSSLKPVMANLYFFPLSLWWLASYCWCSLACLCCLMIFSLCEFILTSYVYIYIHVCVCIYVCMHLYIHLCRSSFKDTRQTE
jgi:hypothetical protein